MPDFHQITISAPGTGTPNLVGKQGEGGGYWKRSQIGGYRSAGKSRRGATRIERDNFKPYYVWTGALLLRRSDLVLLDRYNTLFENDPDVQIVLKDEFLYTDESKAGWHDRAVVTGSETTVNMLGQAFIECNVLLQLDESEHARMLGGGFYLASFTAEELI